MSTVAELNDIFAVIHKATGQFFLSYRQSSTIDTKGVLKTTLRRWNDFKGYKGPKLKNLALSYFTRHHNLDEDQFICVRVRSNIKKEDLRELLSVINGLMGYEYSLNKHVSPPIDEKPHPATLLGIDEIYSDVKPEVEFSPVVPGMIIHSCIKNKVFPRGMLTVKRNNEFFCY